MFRVATLTAFAVLLLSTEVLAEGPSKSFEEVEVAALKPSIPALEPLVEEAALHPPEVEPERIVPNLAARAVAGPRLIVKVSIANQSMDVWIDGEKTHTWKVSTAGKGYVTPKGVWKPYRMHTMWHSRKYDNAPMPHSIFYDGGYAIHATPHVKRLGRPASHGCVRLHPDNAKALFALAKEFGREKMRVIVQN